MQEIILQVLTMVRGAWRYRWAAVVVAWIVAVAGWIGVQVIPDEYKADTQVYVDTESVLKPLLTGLTVNRDIMTQVGMMQAVMLSRPNLEKVAQKTDLFLGANSPREQQAVVDSLAKRITLGRPDGPATRNTFQVSFTDNDPQVAYKVVRTLLDTFMEDSLGMKRDDSAVAQRFLETQIKEYEQRLTEAEQRLAEFKQQNVGLLPGSGGNYYQRLETELNTLQRMQQIYSQIQNRRDELARQMSGEEPTFGMMGSAESSPIDGQIARFKAQRDQLLLQYTEKHPQVQSLNQTIEQLEDEKRAGAKVSQSVAPPGATPDEQAMMRSLDMNPVYQNLRMQLSQADADLAEMRGQLGSQQSLIADLRSRVDAIPEIEAELARLNRDYEVNKQQYDTLLQRLESARISEQAEQSAENVKFRVIEPPTVPLQPDGPKRLLLDTLVLLAAIGAGLGLAILLGQMRPTFSSREMLEKVTGIPVLGSVTIAIRETLLPWYRRQGVMVAGAFGLLVAAFLVNIVLTDHLREALRRLVG